MREVEKYIDSLNLKKQAFGGCDEKEVYEAISEICDMYEAELEELEKTGEELREAKNTAEERRKELEEGLEEKLEEERRKLFVENQTLSDELETLKLEKQNFNEAELDAEKFKQEIEQLRLDADEAKQEIEQLRLEADEARQEAKQARESEEEVHLALVRAQKALQREQAARVKAEKTIAEYMTVADVPYGNAPDMSYNAYPDAQAEPVPGYVPSQDEFIMQLKIEQQRRQELQEEYLRKCEQLRNEIAKNRRLMGVAATAKKRQEISDKVKNILPGRK